MVSIWRGEQRHMPQYKKGAPVAGTLAFNATRYRSKSTDKVITSTGNLCRAGFNGFCPDVETMQSRY